MPLDPDEPGRREFRHRRRGHRRDQHNRQHRQKTFPHVSLLAKFKLPVFPSKKAANRSTS
jgi:hypothetical protein